jgi:hypothetical protein
MGSTGVLATKCKPRKFYANLYSPRFFGWLLGTTTTGANHDDTQGSIIPLASISYIWRPISEPHDIPWTKWHPCALFTNSLIPLVLSLGILSSRPSNFWSKNSAGSLSHVGIRRTSSKGLNWYFSGQLHPVTSLFSLSLRRWEGGDDQPLSHNVPANDVRSSRVQTWDGSSSGPP